LYKATSCSQNKELEAAQGSQQQPENTLVFWPVAHAIERGIWSLWSSAGVLGVLRKSNIWDTLNMHPVDKKTDPPNPTSHF
jgi:hypothetical protein